MILRHRRADPAWEATMRAGQAEALALVMIMMKFADNMYYVKL